MSRTGVLLQDLQSQLQQAESGQQQRSEAGARAEDQVEQLKQQVTDLQAILAAEADRQQLCSGINRPALRSPTRSHGPAESNSPAHLHHKIQELEVSPMQPLYQVTKGLLWLVAAEVRVILEMHLAKHQLQNRHDLCVADCQSGL